MIKDVTITKIFTENKVGKSGKNFESVRIQTQEFGAEYLSGFGGAITKNWKEGDRVRIKIEEKLYNGKTYKNFNPISPLQALEERVARIERTLNLGERVEPRDPVLSTPTASALPDVSIADDEVNVDAAYEEYARTAN